MVPNADSSGNPRLNAKRWLWLGVATLGASALMLGVGELADLELATLVALLLPLVALAFMIVGIKVLVSEEPRVRIACPRCEYDLRASAPEGSCPECGRAYTHAAAAAYWRDHLAPEEDEPTPS